MGKESLSLRESYYAAKSMYFRRVRSAPLRVHYGEDRKVHSF